MKCRLCNKGATEIQGYLARVNELGVAGVWECRPSCGAELSADQRLLNAIAGETEAESPDPGVS